MIRLLLIVLACILSGCNTISTAMTDGLATQPYEATKANAEVAWDVGAMRYEKYTDECPAFFGWVAAVDLPLTVVADTMLLPFLQTNTTIVRSTMNTPHK